MTKNEYLSSHLLICAQNERNKTKSSSPALIVLLILSCGAGTSKRTRIVKIWVRVKVVHDENAIWCGKIGSPAGQTKTGHNPYMSSASWVTVRTPVPAPITNINSGQP